MKKRRQEYTEELYKKVLHDPHNHDGVITHLKPDILECEVKEALPRITTNKASGDEGTPAELFQVLRHDAVKVLHSICQLFGKLSSDHRTGKGQFSFQSQRRQHQRMFKLLLFKHTSHFCKVMLKILQARFQLYVNQELPDVQAGFRKGRGTRSNCQHLLD